MYIFIIHGATVPNILGKTLNVNGIDTEKYSYSIGKGGMGIFIVVFSIQCVSEYLRQIFKTC